MPISYADPQVTITIDTAYRAEGVEATNKGIESLDAAAKQLQTQLDDVAKTDATPKGLTGLPGLIGRIKTGYGKITDAVRGYQMALSRVMWWMTLINGTIDMGRKIWDAWHRDAKAAQSEIEGL